LDFEDEPDDDDDDEAAQSEEEEDSESENEDDEKFEDALDKLTISDDAAPRTVAVAA
ncbi:hypothetical protein H0H92_012244, partial [Tricholoma furcatifolium]